jgi:hypothetical protein
MKGMEEIISSVECLLEIIQKLTFTVSAQTVFQISFLKGNKFANESLFQSDTSTVIK